METLEFRLRGEFIALDALLKATGLAESGGAAKQLIVDGQVRVDGREELRRGAKLRAGQTVELHGTRVSIVAAHTG
jgi:ribosome-associated protein